MRTAINRKEKEKGNHKTSFFRKGGEGGFFSKKSIQPKLCYDKTGIQRKEKRDYSEGFVDDEDQMYQSPIQTKKILGRRGGLMNREEEIQMRPLVGKSKSQISPSVEKGQKNTIQRDLATPPPTVATAAQPDLSDAQIREAITFNNLRYNAVSIRLIQNILGGPVTSAFTPENIRAIAVTQEQYGLTKDGKVGETTFRFIDTEVTNEGLPTTNANCLTSLRIRLGAENIAPRNNGALMNRQFFMEAQFPNHCDCGDYEYRQFIRGHLQHERAGAVTDEGDAFGTLPAGRINAGWQEDGHTGVPSINFGYRNRTDEADNRYIDNAGGLDMANGCRYRGNDTPGGDYIGRHVASPTTGDTIDILVQFRGEIRRNGNVVRTKFWTALRRRFALPV